MTVETVNHPLVQHKLSLLRDQKTPSGDFRRILEEITTILFIHASKDLSLKTASISTPMDTSKCQLLDDTVVLVPILRAGLGMLNPILRLVPDARVEFMGLRRDESTLEPIQYYTHLTDSHSGASVFVLDPMVATGGSVLHTARILKENGLVQVKIISVITSSHAVKRLENTAEEVRLYTASVDPELNKHGFIIPGLGDAGDRIYNTF
ncbi:MAG TPA: uracil phosphoribosyltransferase [Spirochaetota bacterium]|nr:uracil phosphoribosyltransferase [Spirochaetota bacterium]